MKNPFIIGVTNLTQLAKWYKVSLPTMVKWAKPILQKFNFKGRILTTKMVQAIVKHLGLPEIV